MPGNRYTSLDWRELLWNNGQTNNLNPTRIRFYSEAEYIEVKPALIGSSVKNIEFYGSVQKSFPKVVHVSDNGFPIKYSTSFTNWRARPKITFISKGTLNL